jgi:hypothetical protein
MAEIRKQVDAVTQAASEMDYSKEPYIRYLVSPERYERIKAGKDPALSPKPAAYAVEFPGVPMAVYYDTGNQYALMGDGTVKSVPALSPGVVIEAGGMHLAYGGYPRDAEPGEIVGPTWGSAGELITPAVEETTYTHSTGKTEPACRCLTCGLMYDPNPVPWPESCPGEEGYLPPVEPKAPHRRTWRALAWSWLRGALRWFRRPLVLVTPPPGCVMPPGTLTLGKSRQLPDGRWEFGKAFVLLVDCAAAASTDDTLIYVVPIADDRKGKA